MVTHMSLYAILLAFVFVFLSMRIIKIRRMNKISLGDAQNPALIRAIRAHANFAEFVPLGLFLLLLVELSAAQPWLVHVLGASLLFGRLSHAWGISQVAEKFKFRISGMLLTFTSILVSACFLAFQYVSTLLHTL